MSSNDTADVHCDVDTKYMPSKLFSRRTTSLHGFPLSSMNVFVFYNNCETAKISITNFEGTTSFPTCYIKRTKKEIKDTNQYISIIAAESLHALAFSTEYLL